MEVIIMKSGSFRALMDKIEAIEKHICHSRTESEKPPLQEIWLDNKAVCTYLKISKRTVQRYRSSGELPFQMIYHKTYYKESDVIAFIEKHFSSFRNINKKEQVKIYLFCQRSKAAGKYIFDGFSIRFSFRF